METAIYNLEGKKAGDITLPENVFGLKWNADLVKQVAVSLMSSKRKPVAHTKTRGEVRGGGKKPWKQKGTGRARHGSSRSPIWVGGGVTGGPRNDKNFVRKVSKTMRVQALRTLLSRKWRDGEILFADSLTLKQPKTREAIGALTSLSSIKGFERVFTKKKNATLLALATKDKKLERAFANLGNVEMIEARNLNPLLLLQYKYVIIENPKVSLDLLPKARTKLNV